jgi:hypothetical protein
MIENGAQGFWSLRFKDILDLLILLATIVAIYYGPIRAVQISRANDDRREKRRREFEIFSNLMKTRRMVLDPLHVVSLNLVEVEFFKNADVIAAYRSYIDNLNKRIPESEPQQVIDRYLSERDDAFYVLIHALGKHLDFSFDKRDLKKFSYVPQGWQNIELETQNLRRLVVELLLGRRYLPTKQFLATDISDKFPPPPD